MGYPSTVDTGQIQMDVVSHAASWTTSSGGNLTAGAAYLVCVTIPGQATITQMRCSFSGTVTGNCDMGIYDATAANNLPGNLLGHTGAIAAVTGLFTQNLTSPLILNPGKYWLAWLDTVSDAVYDRGTGANLGPLVRTSATNLTVLPSTCGAVSNTLSLVAIFALVQNGWS